MKTNNYIFISALILSLLSCESFIDIDPPKTQVVTSSVYTDDITATSAIRGIYSSMISDPGFASGNTGSITHLSGLSADEFSNYNSSLDLFVSNSLTATTPDVKSYIWDQGYKLIYYSNSVIHGLSESHGVTESTKNQLLGEAKFIRAFCHFYLTNIFGDVPLVITTDYRKNNTASREPASKIYEQIILDLKDAQDLLANDFSFSDNERIRPNKWTAKALLARTYLYLGKWEEAESEATSIIDHSELFSLVQNLNEVFLKNSTESIWQLKPADPLYNTNEAKIFSPSGTEMATPGNIAINESYLNMFESGDQRKVLWINEFISSTTGEHFFYPYKYKVAADGQELTEYYSIFRLSEQFLIRAEARLNQANKNGSIEDINIIRNRAGLSNTEATEPDEIAAAIKNERVTELFAEWGHRWFDLKRWNKADEILSAIKGDVWQSTDVLYPIPQSEREANTNLSQNQGY